MGSGDKSYIHQGGDAGAERLKVLANATWPTTKAFLLRAGLEQGMRCLDVGCGGGDLTLRFAKLVSPDGSIVGVDYDARKIEIASHLASQSALSVEFRKLDVTTENLDDDTKFDFILARFLLWTLKEPETVLSKLISYLRPGGIIAIEDIDSHGQYCYPPCESFERYFYFHNTAAEKMGSDHQLGRRLFEMVSKTNLEDVQVHMEHPVFSKGDGKKIPLITMQVMKPAILDLKLATETELDDYISELAEFTADPKSIITLPCLFQVSGRRAAN